MLSFLFVFLVHFKYSQDFAYVLSTMLIYIENKTDFNL